jgi:hypothetical protein
MSNRGGIWSASTSTKDDTILAPKDMEFIINQLLVCHVCKNVELRKCPDCDEIGTHNDDTCDIRHGEFCSNSICTLFACKDCITYCCHNDDEKHTKCINPDECQCNFYCNPCQSRFVGHEALTVPDLSIKNY